MGTTRSIRLVVVVGGAFALVGAVAHAQEKQPVYVGALACAECHEGHGTGEQFSHWLLSSHAKAWASLALPEAKEMARLSGITDVPERSPICLGCHATAAETEEWERVEGFRLEDGVQCEKCHGPGSEYMSVMGDPEAAMRAGLRRFTKRDCEVCHYVKGSHAAVHNQPKIDVDAAWARLSHPIPEGAPATGTLPTVDAAGALEGAPRLTGTHACGTCHRGPMMGYQYSLWRLSPHARAYATLATPAALEMAKERGIDGPPQTAPACLRCHATGGEGGVAALESFSLTEGVGCESCHGAGSEYSPEGIMRDPIGAREAGLLPVTKETCARCHQEVDGKPFDFAAGVAAIAHPLATTQAAVPHMNGGGGHATDASAAHTTRDIPQSILEVARHSPEELPGEERREKVRASLQVEYKTPVNLAFTPDGREVFVACES